MRVNEAQVDDNDGGPADEVENDPDFSLLPNHNDECKDDYHAAVVELLNQIKENFSETTDPSTKNFALNSCT